MNTYLVAVALVAAGFSSAAFADGGHDYPPSSPRYIRVAASDASSVPPEKPMQKSRADVRRELTEAQHAGVIPHNNNDYPPSAATIKRNKELHEIRTRSTEAKPQ